MRQIVYTCDRCKQAYTPYKSKSGMMGIQMFKKDFDFKKNGTKPYEYGRKKYLCSTCLEEIESWYFEEKDEEEYEEEFEPVNDDE